MFNLNPPEYFAVAIARKNNTFALYYPTYEWVSVDSVSDMIYYPCKQNKQKTKQTKKKKQTNKQKHLLCFEYSILCVS